MSLLTSLLSGMGSLPVRDTDASTHYPGSRTTTTTSNTGETTSTSAVDTARHSSADSPGDSASTVMSDVAPPTMRRRRQPVKKEPCHPSSSVDTDRSQDAGTQLLSSTPQHHEEWRRSRSLQPPPAPPRTCERLHLGSCMHVYKPPPQFSRLGVS